MGEHLVTDPESPPIHREWREWGDGPGGWLWTGVQWLWLERAPDLPLPLGQQLEYKPEADRVTGPDWVAAEGDGPDSRPYAAPVGRGPEPAQESHGPRLDERVEVIVADQYPPLPVDGRRNRRIRRRYRRALLRRLGRGTPATMPFGRWRTKFHLLSHLGLWIALSAIAYGPEWISSTANAVSGTLVYGALVGLVSGMIAVLISRRSDRARAKYLEWRSSIYALKFENDARLRDLGIGDV